MTEALLVFQKSIMHLS